VPQNIDGPVNTLFGVPLYALETPSAPGRFGWI
jgi:hypothetical protein